MEDQLKLQLGTPPDPGSRFSSLLKQDSRKKVLFRPFYLDFGIIGPAILFLCVVFVAAILLAACTGNIEGNVSGRLEKLPDPIEIAPPGAKKEDPEG